MEAITIIKAVEKKGVTLSRTQMYAVSHQAGRIYKNLTGEKPQKIPQEENGQTFHVNAYPAEFEVVIHNLVDSIAI